MEHTTPNAAGAIVRKDFAGVTMQRENGAHAALIAAARAEVEARHVMALHRPRSIDKARVLLLEECKRPGFAEVARYHKPVGDGVEGPSIRFAEAAARCMTNIDTKAILVSDDELTRVKRVIATDLESNNTWSEDVVIEKVVERRQLKRGQQAIRTRANSYGDTLYIVRAEADEFADKEQALISKAMRRCLLRILPGDLVAEGQDTCIAILKDKDAKDPSAARKALIDAFASLSVLPDQLEVYLGHPLAQTTPAELDRLRKLYAALRDGEASWQQALEHEIDRQARARAKPAPAPAPSPETVQAAPAAPNEPPAPAAAPSAPAPAAAPQATQEELLAAQQEQAAAAQARIDAERARVLQQTQQPAQAKGTKAAKAALAAKVPPAPAAPPAAAPPPAPVDVQPQVFQRPSAEYEEDDEPDWFRAR